MKPDEIRTQIDTQLNASWSSTPIAWPNKDFSKDGVEAFIRRTIIMADSEYTELGASGIGERDGVLDIDIFVRGGSGTKTALGYAGTLELLFRRQSLGGVEFEEPSTREIGPDDSGFYQVKVQIPFTTFIGE